MCGGTYDAEWAFSDEPGLSSRVRGNHGPRFPRGRRHGSIPACAGEPRTALSARAPARVYPRVCGGTASRADNSGDSSGLSPRVRGNLRPALEPPAGGGSIPACAGEPRRFRAAPPAAGVYPRVCGGTSARRSGARGVTGLSPRVRGNQSSVCATTWTIGSIPACAGEPNRVRGAIRGAWVYPRVCGGTFKHLAGMVEVAGLSPRVRGNPMAKAGRKMRLGSIPACAGEPPRGSPRLAAAGVYPRVCGGTSGAARPTCCSAGLSPRVRGNRPRRGRRRDGAGSIPACAGEPGRRADAEDLDRVYPRVCGGTHESSALHSSPEGLSPRVRGNPAGGFHPLVGRGSIPACAGEPSPQVPGPARARVYPRVCGGTLSWCRRDAAALGLSPRVRGNLVEVVDGAGQHGSIPACAGEPVCHLGCLRGLGVYPRVCGGTPSS